MRKIALVETSVGVVLPRLKFQGPALRTCPPVRLYMTKELKDLAFEAMTTRQVRIIREPLVWDAL